MGLQVINFRSLTKNTQKACALKSSPASSISSSEILISSLSTKRQNVVHVEVNESLARTYPRLVTSLC
jgi:hypothetical protein